MKGQSTESQKRAKEVEAITLHNREALINAVKTTEVMKDILLEEGIITEEEFHKRKEEKDVSINKYIK